MTMENYPGVWSLPSMRFTPEELPDHLDLEQVQKIMDRLGEQRLRAPVRVTKYLSSATCANNPMNRRVFLHMYEVEMGSAWEFVTPVEEYARFHSWLTPKEYKDMASGAPCGLCMRMWSDYCVKQGWVKDPFAPSVED